MAAFVNVIAHFKNQSCIANLLIISRFPPLKIKQRQGIKLFFFPSSIFFPP